MATYDLLMKAIQDYLDACASPITGEAKVQMIEDARTELMKALEDIKKGRK